MMTVEHADFVFQSVEVDAGLAAHRGVDHREERCRHVDILDAPFECAGSESTQVGHHAAADIHEQGVACATVAAQKGPYGSERVDCLVRVGRSDGDVMRAVECRQISHEGQA